MRNHRKPIQRIKTALLAVLPPSVSISVDALDDNASKVKIGREKLVARWAGEGWISLTTVADCLRKFEASGLTFAHTIIADVRVLGAANARGPPSLAFFSLEQLLNKEATGLIADGQNYATRF